MQWYTFTMKASVNFDAGDKVIMSIAGHVSRAMLSRYSHVPDGSQAARPGRDCRAPVRRRREAEGGGRARRQEQAVSPEQSVNLSGTCV
jgi:hypothetical protein